MVELIIVKTLCCLRRIIMRVTCRQIAARYFGLRHSVHLVNTFFVCGVRQIVNRMIIHKLDTWRVEMQIAAFCKCQIIQIKAERMSLAFGRMHLFLLFVLRWVILERHISSKMDNNGLSFFWQGSGRFWIWKVLPCSELLQ